MSPMSQAAQNLNWLITNFVDNTPGVSHTVVVSADGLLLAMSEGFPRDRADQLAAVASGLTSLTAGASRSSRAAPSPRPLWRWSADSSSSCPSLTDLHSPSSPIRTPISVWLGTKWHFS